MGLRYVLADKEPKIFKVRFGEFLDLFKLETCTISEEGHSKFSSGGKLTNV